MRSVVYMYGPLMAETLPSYDLKAEELEIHVNSPGGEVEPVRDYCDAVARWHEDTGAKVTVTVDGLAASAAALMCLMLRDCADSIVCRAGSQFMFHSASLFAYGQKGALRDMADYLEGMDAWIRDLILERTTADESDVDQWLSEGRQGWLTADEALSIGIVDEVVKRRAVPLRREEAPSERAVALFYPSQTTTPTQEDSMIKQSRKAKNEVEPEVAPAAEPEKKEEEAPAVAEEPEKKDEPVCEEPVPAEEPEAPVAEEPEGDRIAKLEEQVQKLADAIAAMTAAKAEEEETPAEEPAPVEPEAKPVDMLGGLMAPAQESAPVSEKHTHITLNAAIHAKMDHDHVSYDEAFLALKSSNPDFFKF